MAMILLPTVPIVALLVRSDLRVAMSKIGLLGVSHLRYKNLMFRAPSIAISGLKILAR